MPLRDLQGLITVDGVNRLNFNAQGNIIRVYSNERDKMQGVVQVNIYKGIKNSFGEKLSERVMSMVWEFSSLALTSSMENIFEPGISTIRSLPFFTCLTD